MDNLITLRNVTKSFDGVRAVYDISLEVGKGEFFCLLGPSGCGKTTLLRILAGFEAPDSGLVEIDGVSMDGVDPADRPVNIMFQSYALFPHYTVARNIGYGLVRAGVSGSELDDRVAELLKLVRLEDYGNRKPDQLSGGQRQRVALARALARRPKLLLLDEPLAALDKKLREETQFELVNIQDELGTTFIVVTHDQEEAMVLADRIGVMDKGRILQIDPPRQLYEQPRSRFVADFVGSVSFLDATVVAVKKNSVLLDVKGTEMTATPPVGMDKARLKAGARLTTAIRPEKITLTKTRPKGGNSFAVTIDDLAFTGVATYYRAHTDNGLILRIHQENQSDRAKITWDDKCHAAVDPADIILLTD